MPFLSFICYLLCHHYHPILVPSFSFPSGWVKCLILFIFFLLRLDFQYVVEWCFLASYCLQQIPPFFLIIIILVKSYKPGFGPSLFVFSFSFPFLSAPSSFFFMLISSCLLFFFLFFFHQIPLFPLHPIHFPLPRSLFEF